MKKAILGVALAGLGIGIAQAATGSVVFDSQIKLSAGTQAVSGQSCNNLKSMLQKNFSNLAIVSSACYNNKTKDSQGFLSSFQNSLTKAGYQSTSSEILTNGYIKQTWNSPARTVAVLYSFGTYGSTMVIGGTASTTAKTNPKVVADTPVAAPSGTTKNIPKGVNYIPARELVDATHNNGSVEVTAVLENSKNTADAAKGDYTIYINNRMAHVTVGSNRLLTERFSSAAGGDLAARPAPESMDLNAPAVIYNNRLLIPNDLLTFFGCSLTPGGNVGRVSCSDTTIYDAPFSVNVPLMRF